MFITPNTTVLGGRGFSIGGGEILKTATGYPLILTKTLAKQPESIAVFGNDGGVGDRTANIFNAQEILGGKGYTLDSNGYWRYHKQNRVTIFSEEAYIGPLKLSAADFGGDTLIQIDYADGSYYWLSSSQKSITIQKQTKKIDLLAKDSNKPIAIKDILVSKTPSATYEPYGYKIPLVISDGTTNKTINLYSDAALGANDSLVVSPTAQTAMRGSTDLSALQDWTQDWTIPEADELTVTAGTTVQPSNMEIQYYGKR